MPNIAPISNNEIGSSVRAKMNTVIGIVNGIDTIIHTVSSPSASWSLSNPFSVIPDVQVYLSNGERVYPDIYVTASNINAVFASAQTGYLVIK